MILNVVRRRCRISDCQIYSAILHNECRCEIEVVCVDFDKIWWYWLDFPCWSGISKNYSGGFHVPSRGQSYSCSFLVTPACLAHHLKFQIISGGILNILIRILICRWILMMIVMSMSCCCTREILCSQRSMSAKWVQIHLDFSE